MIRVATIPQQRARHRRWRAPNDPTRPAKQIWAHLYPDQPWPMGWEVKWAGFIRGATGLTSYSRRVILLSYGDARRATGAPVETPLHEFVHLRCGPTLRHGQEFSRLLNSLRLRCGFAPEPWVPRRRLQPVAILTPTPIAS
jgi:hypothetical protein